MRFGILGPLEVADESGPLELGGRKQRAVLAILLLHANEVVSSDQLIEDLWSGRPPASAATSLQAHVSRLRRTLGGDQRIVTTGGGYLVQVAPGELDSDRFERLFEEGSAAVVTEDWESASAKLREALALWRGAPLNEFRYDSFAQAEIARLCELQVRAVEQRVEAELALGREATVIGDLERLVREHPYRERLRAQLMLALYRTGRQAEALAAYRKARSVLVDELGIEPSPELRELHEAILTQDPSLLRLGGGVDRAGLERVRRGDAASSPLAKEVPAAQEDSGETSGAAPLGETQSPRQARKVVTSLFCDATGSTALGEQLDPEVLREVLNRYFAELRTIIERHGGTVEKFIGDAVMAVFGIPRVHEDDALRAVRAAAEIRERLPAVAADVGVELRFRTGVNTGPVLMAEGENLAVGDAVNVAARLEQAAQPGQILIAEETFRLVRDAVVVQPLDPLELKGKVQRVPAYRLVSVDPAAPGFARHLDARLIGRARELEVLRQSWDRTMQESRCHLLTLLGEAGVGKSRLVAELLAEIEDDATVLSGRCLHYGEGITFWPLVEALMPVGEPAHEVLEHLGAGGAATPEELFWEVRRLLESIAAESPVVLYLDDLHWAEAMLLDLLDHVADLSRGAPILLLCTARPELLDERPGWAGGKLTATTVLLEPLTGADSEALLDELGDGLEPEARARVIEASEGNPLFLEEMVALAPDRGTVEVPPTIQALLAARLERLGVEERELLERGAIEGQVFHRSAVSALVPSASTTDVELQLANLVRKDLIRPHAGNVRGDEAFRFRHLLIRDAAYERLPKALRADLHERYANWLENTAVDFLEVDEIAGWHLEQAVRHERELRREVDARLMRDAASHLFAAGRRAGDRSDLVAAGNFLNRALELAPSGDPLRIQIEVELAGQLIEAGDLGRADELLAAAERADPEFVPAALARLEWLVYAQPNEGGAMIEEKLPQMLSELTRSRDDRGLAKAHMLAFWVRWTANQATLAAEQVRLAAEHARKAGDSGLWSRAVGWYVATLMYGPQDAETIASELESIEQEEPGPYLAAFAKLGQGEVARLHGRFDEARRFAAQALDGFRALGSHMMEATCEQSQARIEVSGGDGAAAVAALLRADTILAEFGERSVRSTTQALLARAHEMEQAAEAAQSAIDLAEELSAPQEATNYAVTHEVRGRLALRHGDAAGAERWARSALDHALKTDFIEFQAQARLGLAHVLAAVGRKEEARSEGHVSLRLFDAKGDHPGERAARTLLDGLGA